LVEESPLPPLLLEAPRFLHQSKAVTAPATTSSTGKLAFGSFTFVWSWGSLHAMNQELVETFIDARHNGTHYLAFLLAVPLAVSHFGQNLTAQLHPRLPCYLVEVCMHHKALSVSGRHRQGIN